MSSILHWLWYLLVVNNLASYCVLSDFSGRQVAEIQVTFARSPKPSRIPLGPVWTQLDRMAGILPIFFFFFFFGLIFFFFCIPNPCPNRQSSPKDEVCSLSQCCCRYPQLLLELHNLWPFLQPCQFLPSLCIQLHFFLVLRCFSVDRLTRGVRLTGGSKTGAAHRIATSPLCHHALGYCGRRN